MKSPLRTFTIFLLILFSRSSTSQEAGIEEAKGKTLLFVRYDVEIDSWRAEAERFSSLTIERLRSWGGIKVDILEQFKDIFEEDPYQILASCTEKEVCLILIGEKAGADFILYGKYWKEGETNLLNLGLIGVEEEVSLNSITIPFGEGYEGEMLDILVDFIVKEICHRGRDTLEEVGEKEEGGEGSKPRKVELPEAVRLDFERFFKGREEKRVKRRIDLKKLEDERDAEGFEKEWEKVGMDYAEYLEYLKSGLSYDEWNRRKMGVKSKISLFGGFGWHLFSYSLDYLDLKARDPLSSATIDEYSFQGIGKEGCTFFQAGIRYGLFTYLDIGFSLSYAPSNTDFYYYTQIGDEWFTLKEDDFHQVRTGAYSISGAVRYFFFLIARLKPFIGAGLFYDHLLPLKLQDEVWRRFSSCNAVGVNLNPGVTLSLMKCFSIFFELALRLRLYGNYYEVYDTGGEYIDRGYNYETPTPFYLSPNIGFELLF